MASSNMTRQQHVLTAVVYFKVKSSGNYHGMFDVDYHYS